MSKEVPSQPMLAVGYNYQYETFISSNTHGIIENGLVVLNGQVIWAAMCDVQTYMIHLIFAEKEKKKSKKRANGYCRSFMNVANVFILSVWII